MSPGYCPLLPCASILLSYHQPLYLSGPCFSTPFQIFVSQNIPNRYSPVTGGGWGGGITHTGGICSASAYIFKARFILLLRSWNKVLNLTQN